jgi:signal transduction histidine kinase/CheY-like chemotaxis protein
MPRERRQTHRAITLSGLQRRVFTLVAVAVGLAVLMASAGLLAAARDDQVWLLISRIALAGLLLFLFGSVLHVWRLARQHLADLQNALSQLREARSAADSANVAKSRFLATVSHELRTPLNGVLGMTGLLLDTRLSGEQQTYAQAVDTSARSLLSIIDELLDAARSEAGELVVTPGEINLVDLLESIIELLAPRAHAKQIEIACYISPLVPVAVTGDAKRLRQVLLNIIGNAVKFTPSGGVTLSVEPGPAPEGVRFTISDTGHGIPVDEQAAVFDRFVQSSLAETRAAGGTGLGLSITRDLVHLMGGSISVESQVGEGSTFLIDIPMLAAGAEQPPAFNAALQSTEVFIVMRDGPSCNTLMRYLSDHEAVLHCTTCLDALTSLLKAAAAARDGDYKPIVLLDAALCSTPADVRITARRLQCMARVWVLLRPEERRAHRALIEDPAIGYLVKPVRQSTLLHQLSGNGASGSAATGTLPSGGAPDRTRRSADSLRVALVEDNPINRLLAERMLISAGMNVEHFGTGELALASLGGHLRSNGNTGFDVVLMDIQMPGIDGLETTRRLRALEEQFSVIGAVPVLALSANARRDDQKASLSAGMNGYLAKPFDRADLEQAIMDLALQRAA